MIELRAGNLVMSVGCPVLEEMPQVAEAGSGEQDIIQDAAHQDPSALLCCTELNGVPSPSVWKPSCP